MDLNDTNSKDNLEEENVESSDNAESFFDEEMGIHYLCFLEKNCDVKNVRLENANLFGIKNITVVQRGFRFPDSSDPWVWKNKWKNSSTHCSSLKEIDEFEYDYDDDDVDENEYEVAEDDDDDDFDDNENDVFDDEKDD